jgi:hypothetical protein
VKTGIHSFFKWFVLKRKEEEKRAADGRGQEVVIYEYNRYMSGLLMCNVAIGSNF